MSESNADTLDEHGNPVKPTGAPANTPANGGSSDPIEELKNKADRAEARAATAQQAQEVAEKKARNEKILRIAADRKLAALAGGGDGAAAAAAAASASNAGDDEATTERLKAEKGIANLLMLNPEYQELLKKDETLKDVMLNNPLSLLTEYIDAEDAVEQIQKKLNKRLETPVSIAPVGKKPGEQELHAPSNTNSIELKGSITPEKAAAMSAQDWSKLPKEQRDRMKKGEF